MVDDVSVTSEEFKLLRSLNFVSNKFGVEENFGETVEAEVFLRVLRLGY